VRPVAPPPDRQSQLGWCQIEASKYQPGSFVVAPAGTAHDFENRTGERAGALNISVPGDFEPHMEGIAAWFRARSAAGARTENAPPAPSATPE